MAVVDLWTRADGTPSKRAGQGRRWRVVVPGHPSRSFSAKTAAESWERKLWATEPVKPVDRSVTVGALVDRWLEGKAGLSKKGYEGARIAAARVRTRWGEMLPADVHHDEVQAWLVTVPPASARKASQALGGAMRIAVARNLATANPTVDVRLPKEQPAEGRTLSLKQVRRITKRVRIGSHDWGPLVWLLVGTGLRPAEAVALDVGDVDVKRGRLRVRTSKNRMARDVPVPGSVIEMLDLKRPKDAPLFVGVRGRRLNLGWWRKHVFNPAVRAAKVKCRLYDLRHTAVSLAIASGADVKVVQRMVGHKSAKMTLDVYGHLLDGSLDDVSARMDGLLRGK